MNKLEKIQFRFAKDEYGEYDLFNYGEYVIGLTETEVLNYFKVRLNSLHVKKIKKSFFKWMRGQTCGVHFCPECNKQETLYYRHDVHRFYDFYINKKLTWFD